MAEVSESNVLSFQCSDALDDEGYVLGYPDSTTNKVAKAAAGAAAFGVAFKSTKNPVTGTAEADKAVGVVQAPRYAYVQYNNGSGETIAVGDLVSTKGANAAGTVKKHAATAWPGTWASATAETISDEDAMIVGIALEAKAASTSGKLLVKLLCPIPLKQ